MTTRRVALAHAAALVAAFLAGGGRATRASAQGDSNATALGSVIALQQSTLVTYETLARRGLLDARGEALMRTLAAHEREQAAALARALEEAGGGEPPEPPAARSVEGLDGLGSAAEALAFALALETRAVAACYDAVGQLDDARGLRTVAAVMAADAQHLVLLREAAGEQPLPEAFVTGAPVG